MCGTWWPPDSDGGGHLPSVWLPLTPVAVAVSFTAAAAAGKTLPRRQRAWLRGLARRASTSGTGGTQGGGRASAALPEEPVGRAREGGGPARGPVARHQGETPEALRGRARGPLRGQALGTEQAGSKRRCTLGDPTSTLTGVCRDLGAGEGRGPSSRCGRVARWEGGPGAPRAGQRTAGRAIHWGRRPTRPRLSRALRGGAGSARTRCRRADGKPCRGRIFRL